jgi:hypothetical protein
MTIDEGIALQEGDPVWVWHGCDWMPAHVRGLRFGRLLHIDVVIEAALPLSGQYRKKTPSRIARRNPDLRNSDKPRTAGNLRSHLAVARWRVVEERAAADSKERAE